jgi:hypothetical protein
MEIIKGKEKEYKDWYDLNSDPYSRACFTYAERWANMMENAINKGKDLKDVAERLSLRADTEGITGFMYGVAVSILSQVWIHGEELRRWHNINIQIDNEDSKVNKEGGVLNPALLNIG